jgi:nicotinamidase-related amidase
MKTALVIIDMQKGFINSHTKHLPKKIADFIDNNEFDEIIGTQYINHPNTACYKFEGWKGCMDWSDEVDIVPELADKIQTIFKKDTYSCWNNPFERYIRFQEFDKLYFVGVNIGCCVLASVFDAYNSLQDCAVISDLCGTTSGVVSYNAALQVLRENITKERVILANQYGKNS